MSINHQTRNILLLYHFCGPSLTRILLLTAEAAEHLHAERREDEEQQEEEEAEVANLRQRLHHSVQQSSDPLGHLEELEDARYSEDSHHPDQSGVDDEGPPLHLLQSNADDGEESDPNVKLVPSQ